MSASLRTIKGCTAIVGIGETAYYKRGKSPDPEFKMGLEAILRAVDDAGIDVRDLDGFASYSDDRNEASRMAAALGVRELRHSSMVWGGGGGGVSGAVGNAVAAVSAGYADHVVVFRALAQGQFGRLSQLLGATSHAVGPWAYVVPYGMVSGASQYAMKVTRYMYEHGVGQEALRAVALASYHHAQSNPRAVMCGKPLTSEAYDESRWIVEPFHLFDCCQENDGAAAVIITSAERAADMRQAPAYVWAAAQGADYRQGASVHNEPDYPTSNFKSLARRLYEMAGIGPTDIDVVQSYENFTGGVVMALVEHGFCTAEEVNDFFTLDNLTAPTGGLPLNTSGGNLAECYVHGLELVIEAVRQVRGQSTCQAKDVDFSMVVSGPMVAPASNLLLASSAN